MQWSSSWLFVQSDYQKKYQQSLGIKKHGKSLLTLRCIINFNSYIIYTDTWQFYHQNIFASRFCHIHPWRLFSLNSCIISIVIMDMTWHDMTWYMIEHTVFAGLKLGLMSLEQKLQFFLCHASHTVNLLSVQKTWMPLSRAYYLKEVLESLYSVLCNECSLKELKCHMEILNTETFSSMCAVIWDEFHWQITFHCCSCKFRWLRRR